jgi:hypothetical protein
MKQLTTIGLQTNTDKATYHRFTEIYDDIFSQYTSPRILEIGVYNFASIAMYQQYFNNPYIVAMDIDDKSQYVNDSWKFVHGDQTKIEDLAKCVCDESEKFDIILDDGGHTMKQQQITFGFLIDYVKPGGYYILEDLHTSFRRDYIDSDCKVTTYDMLIYIYNNELNFSNYIDMTQQNNILNKIDDITIWAKDTDNLYDSVTAIIKIK